MSGIAAEPYHKVDDFVRDVLARRELFRELEAPLVRLIGGLVDQLAQIREDHHFDPKSISFEHIRWTKDGQIVFDLLHDRRRFYPRDARPWA